uniref:NADH-ubiquinone oxidoreductase chain 6 n=1 Tax=Selaroides leptolepis TaxID=173311 RepID=A0A120L1C1_SELLE|nr:NADH dehydrogenase subunit 6 [Selaroides leptolepis]
MTIMMYLVLLCFVFGLFADASNPSPYFAALGLVVVAGMGWGLLMGRGGPFWSLVLLLIYVGGMLVVFANSAARAAVPYAETSGSRPVSIYMVAYVLNVVAVTGMFCGGGYESTCGSAEELPDLSVSRGEMAGVAFMYSFGRCISIMSAWDLVFTWFVVLELSRGLWRGALRAV